MRRELARSDDIPIRNRELGPLELSSRARKLPRSRKRRPVGSLDHVNPNILEFGEIHQVEVGAAGLISFGGSLCWALAGAKKGLAAIREENAPCELSHYQAPCTGNLPLIHWR